MINATNKTNTCAPIQVKMVKGSIFFCVETNNNPVALIRKQNMPAMIHTMYCGMNVFLLKVDSECSIKIFFNMNKVNSSKWPGMLLWIVLKKDAG